MSGADNPGTATTGTGTDPGATVSVYLVPHADDETLTMGAAIAADVREHRQVQLVLVTDGQSQRGLRALNADLSRRRPGAIGLTMADYSRARWGEFVAASSRLGVGAGQLSQENIAEGQLNGAAATGVVERALSRYGPTARYRTMSWLDDNPTHYRLGYALDAACAQRGLSDCRYFQSPRFQLEPDRAIRDSFPVVTPAGGWVVDTSGALVAAAAEYARWDPAAGRYAIGAGHSVPSLFAHLRRFPRSWWHAGSTQWRSEADRQAAHAWVSAHHLPRDQAGAG